MSLLQLSPEATRLRRIAKACAAGELTRTQYRQARREVIGKFAASLGEGDEDTVPRYDLDVTQRRATLPATESIHVVQRQNWPMWMLLIALVFAALLAPLFSQAADVIPAVRERDPNPATAPRYPIDQVQWDTPAVVSESVAAQAQDFLDQQLQAAKQQNAPQAHGFSADELEEIGRYLNAVGVHDDNAQLTRADVEDLNALIQSQKERRGVALTQLEDMADALQLWVRDRGFPLARAYLPAQTVQQGSVQLQVQLGVLEQVQMADSNSNDMLAIKASMEDLLGQPVRRDVVETRLNNLNRTPGLHVEASFVPGEQVGATQMVLQVKQQQRFTGAVMVDNYGVEDLGEERLALQGQWNNPRGVGDALAVRAFTTIDPADHQYAEVSYNTPVLNGRLAAAGQLSFADISLGKGVPLDGDGVLFDVELTDTALFTRTQRREWYYKAGLHDLDWDQVPDQRTWLLGAGLKGHRLWDARKLALSGFVEGLFGGVDDERPGQDSKFWRLRAGFNAWSPLDLPLLSIRSQLVLDVQWQLANDLLPPTLRFGATGPYANKGFAQASTLLDQGVGVTGALRFDAPVGQWWMFVDTTYGEQEGELQRWRALTSAGLGWEGQLLETAAGRLSSRVTLGYPLVHKGTQGLEDDGTQLYWSLRFDH